MPMSWLPTTTLASGQAGGSSPGQRRRAACQSLPIARTARRSAGADASGEPSAVLPPHSTLSASERKARSSARSAKRWREERTVRPGIRPRRREEGHAEEGERGRSRAPGDPPGSQGGRRPGEARRLQRRGVVARPPRRAYPNPHDARDLLRSFAELSGTIETTATGVLVSLDPPDTPMYRQALRSLVEDLNTIGPTFPGTDVPVTYEVRMHHSEVPL